MKLILNLISSLLHLFVSGPATRPDPMISFLFVLSLWNVTKKNWCVHTYTALNLMIYCLVEFLYFLRREKERRYARRTPSLVIINAEIQQSKSPSKLKSINLESKPCEL